MKNMYIEHHCEYVLYITALEAFTVLLCCVLEFL